jgi:nucleotide-binding universal stress UspA family protein
MPAPLSPGGTAAGPSAPEAPVLDQAKSNADAPVTRDPVFRSIICGVNGTRGSQEAARQAAVLAGSRGSLCYFAVTYEAGVGATASAVLGHAHGERAASDARRRARELGVKAEAFTLHASPATDVLLRRAADHDLLVLGAGFGSRATGIILGRTATAAVHRSPVPVLLTRRPPRDAEFPKRILVSADGKPQADEALRLAAAIAAEHGAQVAVVAPATQRPSERHVLAEELAALAGARGVEAVVIEGHAPAHAAICAAAVSFGASLIIVGSRGLTGARALGSVSERVAHEANCSVLVVRPPAMA